ncbi:MAG: hypothetical protein CL946_04370 [Ectothiorhodospiraceae bacterium]|nr:hypothetical protein [Ectothiorhodospiraceae bacterium]
MSVIIPPRRRILFTAVLCALSLQAFAQESSEQASISLYLEEGKSGAVWDCVRSPDGKILYSCGRDSTAKSWNTATGEAIRTFKLDQATLVTCLALSPDGRTLVMGDMNGAISVWNADLGRLERTFTAHEAYILDVTFTPDGAAFVTAGRDDAVHVWDASLYTKRQSFQCNAIWVNAIALHPDGERLAVAGQDGSIRLWNSRRGLEERTFGTHSRFARTCAFSDNGKYLLSGGRDGKVKIWDSETGVFLREFSLESGAPHHIEIMGSLAVVACANGRIEIWDFESMQRIANLGGASYGAMSASINGLDRRLFTAHIDGSIKVWNTEDWSHLLSMVGFSDGQWLSFTPDGYYDASAFGDRYVQWRVGEELFPLQQFEAIYKSPGTVEDALRGTYTPKPSITDFIDPPELDLISPRSSQIFAFGTEPMEVVVDALATDARGVDAIAIAVNGRPMYDRNLPEARVVAQSPSMLRKQYRIPVLPGANTIDVVAINSMKVKSEPASALIEVITQSREKPNLFVLAVGIDQYSPQYPNLQFASDDAKAIAETFSRQEGTMYERVYTSTLTNNQATKDNILKALDEFPTMTPRDVLVLFFGGHGVRARNDKGNSAYYYVTSGAQKDRVSSTALAWEEFASKIAKSKAGRVIMLLDACHSGAVSAGASNEKVAAELTDQLGVVFASSSGNEFSFEDASWKHGAFTKAILEALDGQADYTKDNAIDWNEFQLYVTNTVNALTKGSQNPMIPRLQQFGNFKLVRIR